MDSMCTLPAVSPYQKAPWTVDMHMQHGPSPFALSLPFSPDLFGPRHGPRRLLLFLLKPRLAADLFEPLGDSCNHACLCLVCIPMALILDSSSSSLLQLRARP
ncbi:hypothetical protein VPH35_117661 [Triticum aestivum]